MRTLKAVRIVPCMPPQYPDTTQATSKIIIQSVVADVPYTVGNPLAPADGFATEPWMCENILVDPNGDFLVVCLPDRLAAENHLAKRTPEDASPEVLEWEKRAADWVEAQAAVVVLVFRDTVKRVEYGMHQGDIDAFLAAHLEQIEAERKAEAEEPDEPDEPEPDEADEADEPDEASSQDTP